MGIRNSSRTRVAPVFNALLADGGPEWVSRLLDLVARDSSGVPRWRGLDLSVCDHAWDPERPLDPPVALLSWLVRNIEPRHDGRISGSAEAVERRAALLRREPSVVRDALRELRRPSRNGWHIFEGPTCPDAFIVTPDALIVVEGKRTEPEPTTYTEWMPVRHQMLRHIDAAWEVRGRRSVYGFFVVEADPMEDPIRVPNKWKAFVERTRSPDVVARSLPHRGPEEQQGIVDAFIGATTWQRVVGEFGLRTELLTD